MSESEVEAIEEELPPDPDDVVPVEPPTLAEKEAAKLARMTPEQRARYDEATEDILSQPVVAAFQEEEERREVAKADVREAFLAAYRKKQKEKP